MTQVPRADEDRADEDPRQDGAHGLLKTQAVAPLLAAKQNGRGERRSTFEIEPVMPSEDDEVQPHRLGESASLLSRDHEDSVQFWDLGEPEGQYLRGGPGGKTLVLATDRTMKSDQEGVEMTRHTVSGRYEGGQLPVEQVEEFAAPKNFLLASLLWIKSWALPGIGMFCEAYFVFSIGNIHPILAASRPACMVKFTACPEGLIGSETYIQVAGIMLGMFTMGFIADQIGRKWGSTFCATFMFIGGILLTASGGPTLATWAWMFVIGEFVFGYGVGGEYPLASSSAAERAEENKAMRERRGEMIVCTFSMQGWGNFVNTCVILIFLTAFGLTGVDTKKMDPKKLDLTWRLSFVVGLIPITFMLIYRLFFLRESKVFIKQKKNSQILLKEQSVLWKHYWHRLLGTCGAWFFWDVSFYGNKLFQSTFINIISGGHASLQVNLMWTALNSFIALTGYYFAAFTIDKKWMGRVRLQNMGFTIVFICFLICAVAYKWLISTPNTLHLFQFLYFASSFFGQFGPNATTWMLPGEIFPTDVRATCHGLSATVGKAGALLAGIFFHYMSTEAKFYVSAFFNLIGLVLTILFIPNILGVDLREGDRRWEALYNNGEYTGEAVNPNALSLWERWIGVGKAYDMVRDGELNKQERANVSKVPATLKDSVTVA